MLLIASSKSGKITVSGVLMSITPFLLLIDPDLDNAGMDSLSQFPQLSVDDTDSEVEATLWTVEHEDLLLANNEGGTGL